MKTMLALAFALTACSHHSEPQKPAHTDSDGDKDGDIGMVDPTLPSWAPKSCKAYHTAVVKAVDCTEIDEPTRTEIKNKYEAANTAWHDMTNAPQSTIDQIQLLCSQDVKYVQDKAAGHCVTAASR